MPLERWAFVFEGHHRKIYSGALAAADDPRLCFVEVHDESPNLSPEAHIILHHYLKAKSYFETRYLLYVRRTQVQLSRPIRPQKATHM